MEGKQVPRMRRDGEGLPWSYNATEGVNWLIPMLKGELHRNAFLRTFYYVALFAHKYFCFCLDTSPCEPSCPPEGWENWGKGGGGHSSSGRIFDSVFSCMRACCI